MNLNDEQTTALKAWAEKWHAVEGDYESTVLRGILHYYCDSGIGTDALSKQDGERLREIFSVDLTTFSLELLNNVYEQYRDCAEDWDGDDYELECSVAISELRTLAYEFGVEDDEWEDLIGEACDLVDA